MFDMSILNRLAGAQQKAEILIEALPWINEFAGHRVVVKYGGNAMINDELKRAFAKDILFMHSVGLYPIVVHGGGPQINSMLERVGIQSEFRGGLRVTDRETMNVVRMVLTGQVQRELVSLLNVDGPRAIGFSGEDAGLLSARRRKAEVGGKKIDIGHVGNIVSINVASLDHMLASGHIPVISTVATDVDNPEDVLNVNADTAAGAIADAAGADKLIILTDVEGLYLDWPDKSSLVSEIHPDDLRALLPSLDSGMKPKMEAALKAVERGVPKAHIIDGRMAHSILLEIFTNAGIGTQVTAAAPRGVVGQKEAK
ncbi:acetylglutamate kinase [Trueperella sp. HMSC08B05]|nr:acetylglutamate kinase [Trueperella sp. HMSC08H06]OFS75341.1 acetylglutamate kinase [Trueperella sp. HMSC08B05]PKZ88720.1 acetylglutamate kinase [Trueperella bernardiae]